MCPPKKKKLEPWRPSPATKAGQSSRVAMEVKATHGPAKFRRFIEEKLERRVAIAKGGS